jgi:hypothetical protein
LPCERTTALNICEEKDVPAASNLRPMVKQMGALYDLPVTKNKKPAKIFIEDVHLTCSPNLGHEQQ